MCARIHQIGLENHGSPIGRLTVSAGVCSVVPVPGTTREKLVETADAALYRAKSAGRNRAEQAQLLLLSPLDADPFGTTLGTPRLIEE